MGKEQGTVGNMVPFKDGSMS